MTALGRALPHLAKRRARTLEELCTSKGFRTRAALELVSPHRALLEVGARRADVRVEGDELLRARLPLEPHDDDACASGRLQDLLAQQVELGGNVRLGLARQGRTLLADTWVDGTAHLPRSLDEIADGFAAVAAASPAVAAGHGREEREEDEPEVDELDGCEPPTCTRQALDEAVEGLGWGEGAVVATGDGWQLRPRVAGTPIAVQLELAGGGLRLRRRVLERVPAGPHGAALCDLASRLNARLRLVRLTRVGDELVAESRAHAGQATPAWIALLARAVASAYRHARAPLEVLAADTRVAEGYACLFLTAEPPSGPERD